MTERKIDSKTQHQDSKTKVTRSIARQNYQANDAVLYKKKIILKKAGSDIQCHHADT
jgi:hypothetical protein